MLLPTVSSASGGKWRCCCRQLWDMLMSPISPRNLRTTALLTSIYQMVSCRRRRIGSIRLIHYVGLSALGRWHADESAIQHQQVCSLNPQNTKITHWICKAIPHRARRFPSKAAIAGSTRPPPTPSKGVLGQVHRAMRPNSRFLVKEPCQDEHPF